MIYSWYLWWFHYWCITNYSQRISESISRWDYLNRLSNTDDPPWCGWASSHRPKENKKTESEGTPPAPLPCTGTWGLLLFLNLNGDTDASWVSSLSAFRLALTLSALLVLRPADSNWNYTIGSFGSQAFRIGLELHFPEFPAYSTSIIYLSGRTQEGVLTSAIQQYILLVLFHWRNLMHMVWGKCLTSFFCMWLFNYLSPIYWKYSFFPHGIVLEPLQ